MKSFFFILGLVLFACSVYCEECDEEAGRLCMLPLVASFQGDGINCEAMIKSKDCFVELAEKCAEDEELRYMVQESVNEIQRKIDNLCEDDEYDDDDDEEDDLIECAGENIAAAMTTCGKEVAEEMSSIQSDDVQDAKCIAFLKVAECASNQVADKCNAEIAEYLLNGMIMGLKTSELGKLVESPRCSAAISEAEARAATQLKK